MRVDIDKLEALEKALEDADQEIAALRTQLEQAQEEGVKSVLRIRCMEHREVPAYNANEASGAECAACAVESLRTQLAEAQKNADAFEMEWDKALIGRAQAEARETALNAEIAALREHQKGIVQGASPLEVAERILAEHDDNIPRGASRQKLDDELCRMCALASTIKTGAERETALRESLEEIERIVTTTGGPQLHMIMKIRDAIARALSGLGE